jgi:hypothetical protein
LEIPTLPNRSRQPHTPAILSDLDLDLDLNLDLDRGGDVGWLALSRTKADDGYGP